MQRMLATDIDGTIYDGVHPADELCKLMRTQQNGLRLCYVTSRSLSSTLRLIDTEYLPPPDYICASVGTVIYDVHAQQEMQEYVYQSLDGWDPESVKKISCKGIVLQEPTQQSPRKVSYYWDGKRASLYSFEVSIRSVIGCRYIASSDCFIDVIPNRMGKGAAVVCLSRILDIPKSSILCAGDTETDLEMCGVMGGFVLPQGISSRIRNIAIVMNSNIYEATRPYDQGIVDGMQWFWRCV